MKNRDIEIKGNGIKVSVLSVIFLALGVITMLAAYWGINRIYHKFDEMMEAYQFVETESAAATSFQTASNYLTDQARKFVVTGDIENANNYFEEKNDLKHREAAIDVVTNSQTLEIESVFLNEAMDLSEALVEHELHAMKLTASAEKIDDAQLPKEVAEYQLPKEEIELSDSEQQNLAIQLLYSSDYEEYKDRINWDVENAITLIKDESSTVYREDKSDLMLTSNITVTLIFVMFFLLVLIYIFSSLLVVKPAIKFVDLLNHQEKLPEIGGYEFRKFARKYNDIYCSNEKNIELLKEQGEIDELTGALKVGTLDMVRHHMEQSDEAIGIIMVDIDNFRSIKEANGYEMADRVVAKVANLFLSHFKSSDYIIRTSQDEFEIFLPKMRQADSEFLVDRISQINQKLKDSSDGVIPASVSVGVAFADSGYTKEVERKADMALNHVKENGRGTCRIAEVS